MLPYRSTIDFCILTISATLPNSLVHLPVFITSDDSLCEMGFVSVPWICVAGSPGGIRPRRVPPCPCVCAHTFCAAVCILSISSWAVFSFLRNSRSSLCFGALTPVSHTYSKYSLPLAFPPAWGLARSERMPRFCWRTLSVAFCVAPRSPVLLQQVPPAQSYTNTPLGCFPWFAHTQT